MPQFNLNLVPMRVSLIGAAVGIALISALAAMYFGRRKRRKAKLFQELYIDSPPRVSTDATDGRPSTSTPTRARQTTAENIQSAIARRRLLSKHAYSNGDVSRTSHSPGRTGSDITRSESTLSVKSDANSSSTITALDAARDESIAPGQLLELGLELVLKARCRWELALQQIDDMEFVDDEGVELRAQLQQLIDLSVRMQNGCKTDYLGQICASAALDAALDEMDREFEQRRRNNRLSFDDSSSDLDSFVSALSMADLSDLDDQRETFQHLALYEAALLELSHGTVACRILRTKMVNCTSDTEFLAKLHCIRLAFGILFEDESNRDWFSSLGRDFISGLLANADRDTEDFLTAYDSMMAYVSDPTNWPEVEEELKGRGVKMMSFYDIVIDFLLFDAFDDLENPPTSVTAILQNRWLTSGFKETALSTAVWSVLKAKRTMLKFPKGFIAHFYTISESTSPVFALGFLGPDGPLKEMCTFFKNHVCGWMWDIFSFQKARYTTVEHLAEDIMRISKHRALIAQERLNLVPAVSFSEL